MVLPYTNKVLLDKNNALLAPSAGALRKMLQVCSDFATERNLSFNAEKTQLIRFRLHKSVIVEDVVEFCGVQLTFVDNCCSLRTHPVLQSF